MKLIKLVTGEDQQSHFQEVDMPFSDTAYGKLTDPVLVKNIVFGEIDGIEEISWHNPPSPQYVIMLAGAMEIEIGDGTTKIFKVGDILLAADTTGQGHITRAASTGARKYLVIPLILSE